MFIFMLCTRHLSPPPCNRKQNHKNKFQQSIWMDGGCVVFGVCVCCVFVNPLNLYFFVVYFSILLGDYRHLFLIWNLLSFYSACHFNKHTIPKLEPNKNIYIFINNIESLCFSMWWHIFLTLSIYVSCVSLFFSFFLWCYQQMKNFFIKSPKTETEKTMQHTLAHESKITQRYTILELQKHFWIGGKHKESINIAIAMLFLNIKAMANQMNVPEYWNTQSVKCACLLLFLEIVLRACAYWHENCILCKRNR